MTPMDKFAFALFEANVLGRPFRIFQSRWRRGYHEWELDFDLRLIGFPYLSREDTDDFRDMEWSGLLILRDRPHGRVHYYNGMLFLPTDPIVQIILKNGFTNV